MLLGVWITKLFAGVVTFTAIMAVYMKQGFSVAYKVVIEKQSFSLAEEEVEEEFEEEMDEIRERYDISGFTRVSQVFRK